MLGRGTVLLTLLLLSAGGATPEDAPAAAADAPAPQPMADFRAPTVDRQVLDTRQLHGKVVLFDVWATWCQPCIAAAPELDRMHQDLKERGLEVVGIAVESGAPDAILRTARRFGMNYPVVAWNRDLAAKIRGLEMVPTYILVGRDWTIHRLFTGATPVRDLRDEILRLLGPEPPAVGP